MLTRTTTLLVAIAAIGIAAAADTADAARFAGKGPSIGATRHAGIARHVGLARHVGAIRHVGINRHVGIRHVGVARHVGIGRHFTPVPGRHARLGFRVMTGAAQAKGTCGTWVCTWPTSNGGCLVWEKTLCKVKTINPFE